MVRWFSYKGLRSLIAGQMVINMNWIVGFRGQLDKGVFTISEEGN